MRFQSFIISPNLTLPQKIALILAAIAAVAIALVLGVIILYIAIFFIAFALIAAIGSRIWARFAGQKPKRHEGMTVYRDRDGVVIDMDVDKKDDA